MLRVRPDHGDTSHLPGQYASLGLGYWEERIDDATDPDLDSRWDKLIRRSYSISSRMFDEHGYLTDDTGGTELEFYIVLVPPTADNIPALTPRLALKRPGDRIYLGPKVAGRYTLGSVIDPSATVVFLSTGTGEAPHNGDGRRAAAQGPHRSDRVGGVGAAVGRPRLPREAPLLGEPLPELSLPADAHPRARRAQALHPGSHRRRHTRSTLRGDPRPRHDPRVPVRQPGDDRPPGGDVDGDLEFPETTGVVELLTAKGFTLDRRKQPGNIHYEEYW